jgi:hypothetical protein
MLPARLTQVQGKDAPWQNNFKSKTLIRCYVAYIKGIRILNCNSNGQSLQNYYEKIIFQIANNSLSYQG